MKKETLYKCSEYFGWVNLIPALLGLLVLPLYDFPLHHSKESLASMLFLQILVGSSLVFTSRQKIRGADIGHKAYPASIAAYVLFALIGYQWI